jgi:tetratricopeptide (TPR) repeat protein
VSIQNSLGAAIAALALASCQTPPPPETSAGDYLSGRLAAGLNDIDAAADNFGAAVAANPDDLDIVRNAFLYHLAAGEIEEAARYATKLASGDDPDGLANYTLAAIRLKNGDLEGARRDLKGEFAEPFTHSIAFLTNAWIEAELAGPDAGIAAFDLGKDVFTGFNPTFKAILEEEKGDIDAARADHQVSIASFGGPIGREAYGAFLERHGDADEARDYYQILDKEGGPTRRLAEAALSRIDRHAPTKAYTDLSATDGAALALYLFAGNVLQQSAEEMQRASEAGFKVTERPFNLPLALAQLSVYLDPELADARRLIGSINNVYGNYAAARAAFAMIAPASPQFEQAQIEIANSLDAEGKTDEAFRVLKSAIRRDKGADEARLTLAGLYASKDRHQEAVKIAGEAIARLPDPPPEDAWRAYVTRASSLIELDRFNDAEADLKRAVEIAPEEPVALNYLGYSWAERGINLDEAFRLIEKAVALRPQSGAIIDSLGWAHFQRGDFAAALPHLEKAASLEPGDPTVTDHLGDVYWRLGREVEARFQWRRALELSPPDRIRALIEAKLISGLPPLAAAAKP